MARAPKPGSDLNKTGDNNFFLGFCVALSTRDWAGLNKKEKKREKPVGFVLA